uniref:NADH dehydrogenase [ubiquinone] flavoprotein 3, mitochondrial n=1 Tax=Cebus imitator TaxID=2715852 RepID=A0A2K5RQ95_CEBIM
MALTTAPAITATAAPLLLRQGRAGVLKIILQEAHVFQGLASMPQNPKKQSTPKNPALAPTEPFYHTTCKNLQHHDYTTYTSLDLNLDLSKFRLPQPSSGWESPRH